MACGRGAPVASRRASGPGPVWYTSDVDREAAARRAARRQWHGNVFRSWEEAEEYDVLFWASIPIADRARVTWELSDELFRLARPDGGHERRLSRSVARVRRR